MSTFQEIIQKMKSSQEALLAQLKVAWESTADDKKSEILHANDDHAFRWACLNGYHEIAEWLWGLCQTSEEISAMLHAKDDDAFREACKYGHIETAKWLWKVCPTKSNQQCYMQPMTMLLDGFVIKVI